MNMRYVILFWSIFNGAMLISMDEPDLEQANKAIMRKQFAAVTKNKAALLCSMVAKEQAGMYNPALTDTENLFRKLVRASGSYDSCSPDIQDLYSTLDDKTLLFVKLITKKAYNRNTLISKINNFDRHIDVELYKHQIIGHDFTIPLYICSQILQFNRYVVNAYGSYEPYQGRIITPLHHVLARIAHCRLPLKPGKKFARLLLEHGANPNAHDDVGNTPLHHAVHPVLVRLLWKHGAQTNIQGQYGRTPLLNHVRLKNVSVATCLLLDSSSTNVPDDKGKTPLHVAAKMGNVEMIQLLLNNGADWTIRNKKDKLPHEMTFNPVLRGIIIDHITEYIKNLLHDNNVKTLKHIARRGNLCSIIDISPLIKWINANCIDDHGDPSDAAFFLIEFIRKEVEAELLSIIDPLLTNLERRG